MTEILDIFKAYNGTGYYCIIFIAALLYLWFTEEDKNVKILLVVVPSVIQILFFIPQFYYVYNRLDEGTYYRVLWILPMALVIAYTACRAVSTHLRLGTAMLVVILALSGTYVYTGATMSRAENEYHLPREVIELCDMIKPEEGRERVWAAFPPILVHYVRQYTTTIQMPFGRDSMVESWKRAKNTLFDLYMSPIIPAKELSKYATDYYCNYVIMEREKAVEGELTSFNMTVVGETENFIIYRNNNVPFFDGVTDVNPLENVEW